MATETEQANASQLQDQKIREAVRSEQGRLRSFIRKRISSAEDAEDIFQDVLYELVESYRLMKPVEQLASWLMTVARNKITDRYRKKKTALLETDPKDYDEDDEPLLIAELLASSEDAADDRMMHDAVMEMIMEALSELPAGQRQAFIMHEIEEKSMQQIAEAMNVPLKTAISRKRYAVIHLRGRLGKWYHDLLN